MNRLISPADLFYVAKRNRGKYNLKVLGRVAHSGASHQITINVIEELAHQIVTIQNLTNYKKGTSINIGSVHGRGAINIVPAYAEADGDIRNIQNQ